jgi:hypothetical protein
VEPLEDRLLLTIEAAVTDKGDLKLWATDALNNDIVITQTGANAFAVTNKGAAVVIANGAKPITGKIDVVLKEANVDKLGIDTGDFATPGGVQVNMGDGLNEFTLLGTINGPFTYTGGKDQDYIIITAGSKINQLATIDLAKGEVAVAGEVDAHNSLSLSGTAAKGLIVHGGARRDRVDLDKDSTVIGLAQAKLFGGDDRLTFAGEVQGRLDIDAGDGEDRVKLECSGKVLPPPGGGLAKAQVTIIMGNDADILTVMDHFQLAPNGLWNFQGNGGKDIFRGDTNQWRLGEGTFEQTEAAPKCECAHLPDDGGGIVLPPGDEVVLTDGLVEEPPLICPPPDGGIEDPLPVA